MAKRLLSAFIGIIIGVSVITFDNIWLYAVVVSFISAVGVWEIIRAVKCVDKKPLMIFCTAFAAVVPFLLIFKLFTYIPAVFAGYILLLFAIMLACHKSIKFEQICMCGAAGMLIPSSLSSIVLLRYLASSQSMGIYFILFLLFSAWFGDSGAYFVGTFFGKHKLCPNVSPKKTVEGLVGGIVSVGVFIFLETLVFNLFIFKDFQINYISVVIIGMLASALGVLGDLSASVIKREFDVKDFGNIMPGHGGVIDRFDSVLFVAPFVYIVYQYVSPYAV